MHNVTALAVWALSGMITAWPTRPGAMNNFAPKGTRLGSAQDLADVEGLVEVEAPDALVHPRDVEELEGAVHQRERLRAVGQLEAGGRLDGREQPREVGHARRPGRGRPVRAEEVVEARRRGGGAGRAVGPAGADEGGGGRRAVAAGAAAQARRLARARHEGAGRAGLRGAHGRDVAHVADRAQGLVLVVGAWAVEGRLARDRSKGAWRALVAALAGNRTAAASGTIVTAWTKDSSCTVGAVVARRAVRSNGIRRARLIVTHRDSLN